MCAVSQGLVAINPQLIIVFIHFGELLRGTLAAKSVTFKPVGMFISGLFSMSMSIFSSSSSFSISCTVSSPSSRSELGGSTSGGGTTPGVLLRR